MKVRIEFTVDIDVDAWMLDYGIDRGEVNADVKKYVKYGVMEHLAGLGVLVNNDADETDRAR